MSDYRAKYMAFHESIRSTDPAYRLLCEDADEIKRLQAEYEALKAEHESLQRSYTAVWENREEVIAVRDKLANVALNGLSGIICTPAEGYVKAPHCLKGDIARVIREVKVKGYRDGLESAVKIAGGFYREPKACGNTCRHEIAEAIRQAAKQPLQAV